MLKYSIFLSKLLNFLMQVFNIEKILSFILAEVQTQGRRSWLRLPRTKSLDKPRIVLIALDNAVTNLMYAIKYEQLWIWNSINKDFSLDMHDKRQNSERRHSIGFHEDLTRISRIGHPKSWLNFRPINCSEKINVVKLAQFASNSLNQLKHIRNYPQFFVYKCSYVALAPSKMVKSQNRKIRKNAIS